MGAAAAHASCAEEQYLTDLQIGLWLGGAVSYRLANRSVAMSGDPESTAEIQERRSLPAGSELLEATPCV